MIITKDFQEYLLNQYELPYLWEVFVKALDSKIIDTTEDKEYNLYIEKANKHKEFFFAGNRPIMYQKCSKYKRFPFCLNDNPIGTLFGNDLYADVKQVISFMRNYAEKEKFENKVVTLTFFKDKNTRQILTPRFMKKVNWDNCDSLNNKIKDESFEPIMYDFMPYLENSECLGCTDEYPYNAVRIKCFNMIKIIQFNKK